MTDRFDTRADPGGLAVFVAVDDSAGASERADVARLLDGVLVSLSRIRGVAATSVMLIGESGSAAVQPTTGTATSPVHTAAVSKLPMSACDEATSVADGTGVVIDLARHRVTVDGVSATLRYRELALLRQLALNRGVIHRRTDLIAVLESGSAAVQPKPRTVDAYLQRVRKALSPYGDAIQTIRGQGYLLDRHPDVTVIAPEPARHSPRHSPKDA